MMPPTPSPAAALEKLRADYVTAYNNRDVSAVAALYASDAVVIEPDGVIVEGRPTILRMLAAGVASWGHITVTPMQMPESPSHFNTTNGWSVGTTMVVRMPVGPGSPTPVTQGTVEAHYLVVAGLDGGSWKIRALASVPIQSASGPHGGPDIK